MIRVWSTTSPWNTLKANPGEIGLNYVEIRKLDSDGKKSSLWKLVLHGSKFENDVES